MARKGDQNFTFLNFKMGKDIFHFLTFELALFHMPQPICSFLVIRKFETIFATNLHGRPLRPNVMEMIGNHHGQNGSFSRSNEPQSK